jgi:predicted alpha/beta-hydrolase family hydrolase
MNPRPFFLFAPGAGAASDSPWMRAWRDRLAGPGDVLAFDYPYRLAGRKAPDRLPVLIAAHRQALGEARRRAGGLVFLVGKSMGSRVGCHVALEDAVAGVITLGYPLVAGSTGALRDQVLLSLSTPILFVQGTRDPLCPLDRLADVRSRMTARQRLHVVEGGNHSLEIPGGKRNAAAQDASDRAVLAAILDFVASVEPTAPGG